MLFFSFKIMDSTAGILWMILALYLLLCNIKTEEHKIEVTYYDNSSELLIYKQLPYIISTDSTTFKVIDGKDTIPGVKQFKIIQ